MEPLNLSTLHQRLPKELHWHLFDTIDSTNQYLLNLAKQGSEGVHICLAEQQTHGRGRRGKNWDSPPGANMYLSILCPHQGALSELSGLSIVIGIALVEALRSYDIFEVKLKWPNDLIVHDKKLGGILIETTRMQHAFGIVIGIGLNITLPPTKAIDQPHIDLTTLCQNPPKRNELIRTCIAFILNALRIFKSQGFGPFLSKFDEHDYLKAQDIKVLGAEGEIFAKSKGINELGELLIEFPNGQMETLHAAEVSVRKC